MFRDRSIRIAKLIRGYLPAGRPIDIAYSTLRYVAGQRRIPRYFRPALFNDHLYRLRNDGSLMSPLRQFITDKEYLKHYVASIVGWEYTLRTIAIMRTDQEVDGFVPRNFPCVIKPSHMSGEVLVLRTREDRLDLSQLKLWLKTNYYRVSREPNYRYLEPRVLVEEFFSDNRRDIPRDFKIHCFHGVPRLIQVDSDRFTRHTRNWYDETWRRLDIEWAYPQGGSDDAKPECLESMLKIAERLAASLSYVRVDMYTDGRVVKVGEMTSCPDGAKRRLMPRAAELWVGGMVNEPTR